MSRETDTERWVRNVVTQIIQLNHGCREARCLLGKLHEVHSESIKGYSEMLVKMFSEVAKRAQKQVVRAGVAVFVFDPAGRFLIMKRKGSHGAGTWGLPGGHIEFGETVAEAAFREVAEETGLHIQVEHIKHEGWSEAQFTEDGKHYITAMCSAYVREDHRWAANARIMEPSKCDEIRWVFENELPDELFPPLGLYLIRHPVPSPR